MPDIRKLIFNSLVFLMILGVIGITFYFTTFRFITDQFCMMRYERLLGGEPIPGGGYLPLRVYHFMETFLFEGMEHEDVDAALVSTFPDVELGTSPSQESVTIKICPLRSDWIRYIFVFDDQGQLVEFHGDNHD